MAVVRTVVLAWGLALWGLVSTAAAGQLDPAPEPGPSCAVPGYDAVYVLGPTLYSGAQQREGDWADIKALGVKHVIDLRGADADPEQSIVESQGLSYQRVPVEGAADLTRDKAEALDRAIAAAGGEPVYVHCVTGRRAAALLAVRAILVEETSREQALDRARRSGLGSFEPQLLEALEAARP